MWMMASSRGLPLAALIIFLLFNSFRLGAGVKYVQQTLDSMATVAPLGTSQVAYTLPKNGSSILTALLMGDSIMAQHWEVVRHYAEALYQKKDFIAGMKAHFVFPYPQRIQRKFDVIYINFATLHMLHLHPAMRWDRRNMGPLYNYRHQLPYILRGLRNYAKDGKVVLMTPPRVCESSYTSAFRDWLEHEEELLATECVPYLASQNLLIKGPQPEANLSDPATALEFCRNYTLTEKGSRRVAEHIREVAQIEQLQVFDFFHWTSRLSCAHAPDGRHYDTDTMRLIMHPLLKELGLPTTPLPVDQDHYEVYADGYKVPLTALETAAMLSSDPMN